jgi:hypothetical protein
LLTALYNVGGQDAGKSQLGQAHALPYLNGSSLPNSHLDEIDAPLRITFDFVLPNSNYVPTIPSELPEVAQITPPISFDLGLPIRRELVLPYRKAPAMPIIAIDKYDDLGREEY